MWRAQPYHVLSHSPVPIPFAPLVGLLFGIAFAWAARDAAPQATGASEGETEPGWRSLSLVLAFAGCVFAPIVGFFAAFHGDWAYLYTLDWRALPSAIDLAIVLVSAACVPAGFVVATLLMRSRRHRALAALALTPSVALLALLALGARRLVVSAAYAQFHGDFGTRSIAASALGRAVLLSAVVLTLAAAWGFRALRR
jgi:hypothetical protein